MHTSKTLVLTGGGTAGHVMPNLALIPLLCEQGWSLHYLGSSQGPERALVQGKKIPFHAISTGKLRRYFSWKNFTDPFRVLRGAVQAFFLLGKLRPEAVFSKGGFVAVPVVYAAFLRGIPVVLHESDLTPGLANRLCLRFCRRICASFPETLEHLPKDKAVLTGTPVRRELLAGNRNAGLGWLGFSSGKAVLLIMGGSQGAAVLNRCVRAVLPRLGGYQIIHLCGPGRLEPAFEGLRNYRQFEFLGTELADVFAASDRVVSRAGANSLFELLALRKPSLLVPLPLAASRGDQILNARSFERRGFALLLRQEELNEDSLLSRLEQLEREAENLRRNMDASERMPADENVLRVIASVVRPS